MILYAPYMVKADRVVRDGDLFPYWPQNGDRVELYGERGLMVYRAGRLGLAGLRAAEEPPAGSDGPDVRPLSRHGAPGQFPASIRTRELPNADIREGHLSTLLCQLANASYRLGGQNLLVDPRTESFTNSTEANRLLRREYRKPWVIDERV